MPGSRRNISDTNHNITGGARNERIPRSPTANLPDNAGKANITRRKSRRKGNGESCESDVSMSCDRDNIVSKPFAECEC